MKVFATREGLLDGRTASGYKVDAFVPFVALPAQAALHLWIKVSYKDKFINALVLDVGPWNISDNAYVFDNQRPQAESGKDAYGRKTNNAGIDLGEKVWKYLGMTDNDEVDWEFIT
jgi:hypothetical protein